MKQILRTLLLAFAGFAAGCGEGYTTTDSGLKYLDQKEGTGDAVKKGDLVEVHYTGWLQDGTKFDSSAGKDPLLFELGAGEVIKGWDEGVAGMKPGGKRKLIIPPKLAYGEKGRGTKVPPNAELTFEVELLRVVPPLDKEDKATTTKTGLKYVDLKEGAGEAAKAGDAVEVYYTGWLRTGRQFDSNVGGQPYPVTIGKSDVIPGWHEGLVGMKAGGKRKLIIPPPLGYGARGFPPDIPPNAVLVFEVELVNIKK